MVTILRPIIVTEATIVGPQPNWAICAGPGAFESTIPNPAYRAPSSVELPVSSDSTLPQFDLKRAARYGSIPVPGFPDDKESDPEPVPAATLYVV
jgi:hypothetical protein